MELESLQPCPFCGSAAHIVYGDVLISVSCSNKCGLVMMQASVVTAGSVEAAEAKVIEKWNTRPGEDAMARNYEQMLKDEGETAYHEMGRLRDETEMWREKYHGR